MFINKCVNVFYIFIKCVCICVYVKVCALFYKFVCVAMLV